MNNWLSENQKQIDYFISSKDVILVDRKKHLETLVELFSAYFPEKKGLRFLDVGCGDGVVSRILFDRFPENEFHLLDGSKVMLEKAKEFFPGGNAIFHNVTFEHFFSKNVNENYFDFVFSSMAIHHVEHHKKFELYSNIFTILKHGGLFVNIDAVLPSSNKTEAIQFKLWKDYIDGLLIASKREEEIEKHKDLIASYKRKGENKPSSLSSQLTMLNEIGFKDVECYHKNGIFVLVAGIKF
jgi:tRNA (cmo5U34)-methyltransferase